MTEEIFIPAQAGLSAKVLTKVESRDRQIPFPTFLKFYSNRFTRAGQ